MRVKTIVDEDFVNYQKPSMFIGTISCSGKCCTEGGFPLSVCQNDGWRGCAPIDIRDEVIIKRYLQNPLTKSIVLGGLEPMEQFDEVVALVKALREDFDCHDDVVIYTGYYPEEISIILNLLQKYDNIIVKFGRYVPSMKSRFDEVLGVTLASENQYAERIS
jgi:hypothetical protein